MPDAAGPGAEHGADRLTPMTASPQTLRRAPEPTPAFRGGSAGTASARTQAVPPAAARVPQASATATLAAAPVRPPQTLREMLDAHDERRYRMRDGRVIELPEDMTKADAAQLEAEAALAQHRLGRGPPPQPVPDVHEAAPKPRAKPVKAPPKATRGRGAAGAGGPRSAGARARLKAVGGKVAQYLVAQAAPVLARGSAALARLSRNEQTHDSAAQKLAQAQKAVVAPANEGQSRSSSLQVAAVGARPAPPVDPKVAQQRLQASLAQNVPRRIEDVDNFQRDMKAQHIAADVLQVVQGEKNAVIGTFADLEQTPPPLPPEQTAEALPAPEAAPATPPLSLGAGAVAPLQAEHTDVRRYTNEADTKLKEEGVTQEQLDMVDSGDLATANQEKRGLAAAAKSEPKAVQQLAQQQAAQVAASLQQAEKKERTALATRRKGGLGAAAGRQKAAKSALEKKREEVAAKINGIYQAAQGRVKQRLALLETQAMQRFDAGNTAAGKVFEDAVQRELRAYKDDRYSGWFGWARKAKDWLRGMDDLPAVKAIFERNRARFVTTIDRLVQDIAAENQRVIQECRNVLTQARQDIQTYVDGLGPALKVVGQKTAGEVAAQLDEMDGFIRRKEAALQQQLADRQQAAIKAIDDKIEKMKAAMAGALAKLGKLLLWAAKKFFTWALGKFGYSLADIENIISRGAAVLKAIFTQPIRFVKNLMRAAIMGFEAFGRNFLKHLQDALFEWLTGSLQGLVLPKTWNLQGIVGVALQMMGISWQNLRRVMVEVMGEKPVQALEQGFALVRTLVTEGPMAAWEQLKDMAGAVRDAFVDAVKDFIKWKIVEEAVKWVVALFIPGAGIVKAIIGIYDTVVFFIQRAKQIAQMVANFLSSIGDIAAGNLGAAATAMENGLARGLSLVIGFLAALLRLSGITAKIKAAIQKIRDKVDAALLKVVRWIADKARALIQRVGAGVKSGVQAVLQWWKKKVKFMAGGESHTLAFQGEDESAQLTVASTPRRIEAFVAEARAQRTAPSEKAALTRIEKLIPDVAKARAELRQLRRAKAPEPKMAAPLQRLETALDQIGAEIGKLLAGDDAGKAKHPITLDWPKPAWNRYPALHLYLTGSTARAGWKLSTRKGRTGWRLVRSYLPTGTHKAGDTQVAKPPAELDKLGIGPPFQVAPKFIVGPLSNASTPGGAKINSLLARYQWSADDEQMDGDHVMEIQFGGKDDLANLWPLDASTNRGAGSKLSTTSVQVGLDKLTIDMLKRATRSPADIKAGKFSFVIQSVKAG